MEVATPPIPLRQSNQNGADHPSLCFVFFRLYVLFVVFPQPGGGEGWPFHHPLKKNKKTRGDDLSIPLRKHSKRGGGHLSLFLFLVLNKYRFLLSLS